jgi:rhodanese-related sulfurtransferase
MAYTEITGEELARRLAAGEKLRVIDVREADEWEAGHIPEAEWIPMQTIPSHFQAWDPNETIYFFCRSGNRSGRVCAWLAHQGFKNVVNVKGGILEYPGPLKEGK